MRLVNFTVPGVPKQQGSKKMFALKKGGQYSGKVGSVEMAIGFKEWRELVVAEARKTVLTQDGGMFDGPLWLHAVFWMPRPASHPKRTYTYPQSAPDLSKLIRAIEDGITIGGLWKDDARVVQIGASEFYAFPPDHPLRELDSRASSAETEPCVKIQIGEVGR